MQVFLFDPKREGRRTSTQQPIPHETTEMDAKTRARHVHHLLSAVEKAKSTKVFEKEVLTY
jgi:hypothetical protein